MVTCKGDLFGAETGGENSQAAGADTQLPQRETVGASQAGREAERYSLARLRSASSAGSYAKKALAAAISAGIAFCAEPSTKARIVPVHSQDIIPVSVAIGYSTLVVLPQGETIMTASCGNKNLWAVDWQGNYAFIKMGIDKAGEHTNANLVTASGNVYSLLLKEVSESKTEVADLKVILEQEDAGGLANMDHPEFVRADLVSELKQGLAKKEEELAQAKRTAAMTAIKEQHHDYSWKHGKEADAFGIKSIWHDNKYTYIEAESQNAPSLYEVIDGKDSVVQYSLEDGKYVVTHVMSHGIFRAGKTKLEFKRGRDNA
jgi:type IV secretory pathway VirB9-like protein